jgi:hypothetical protein
MKGEFPLFPEAEKIYNSAGTITDGKIQNESFFAEKMRYVRNFKKVILMCIHGAVKKFEKSLVSEQEVLNNIADMMMDVYLSESLLLRIEKRETLKGSAPVYRDMLDVNFYDAAARIRKSAQDAVYSFAAENEAQALVRASETLTKVAGVNIKDARRHIADRLIEDNQYKF